MAGRIQSPTNLPFSQSTQHNYRTRASTGVAQKNVLYDAKYHPMDEVTRPSQARKHRKRQGITVSSDDDEEEERESTISISSFVDSASSTDSENALETDQSSQQPRERSCVGYSLRKPPANAPNYKSTFHPQDEELGIRHRRTASLKVRSHRGEASATKKRKIAEEPIEIYDERTSTPSRGRDDVSIGRGDSMVLLSDILLGAEQNNIDDNGALYFDNDNPWGSPESRARGRSDNPNSEEDDDDGGCNISREDGESLYENSNGDDIDVGAHLRTTALHALELQAGNERDRNLESLRSLQDGLPREQPPAQEKRHACSQHPSSPHLAQLHTDGLASQNSKRDDMSRTPIFYQTGSAGRKSDIAFFDSTHSSGGPLVEASQRFMAYQCPPGFAEAASSAAAVALGAACSIRGTGCTKAAPGAHLTGGSDSGLPDVVSQGERHIQTEEQPSRQIRYVEPLDVFDLPVGKQYFKHNADSLYIGPMEDFMMFSERIEESISEEIFVPALEVDGDKRAEGDVQSSFSGRLQEIDNSQRSENGKNGNGDGSIEGGHDNTLEQSVAGQDDPMAPHTDNKIQSEVNEIPFIASPSSSSFRIIATASVEAGLRKRPKQPRRGPHAFLIHEDTHDHQPSLPNLAASRLLNGYNQENAGFDLDSQPGARDAASQAELIAPVRDRSTEANIAAMDDSPSTASVDEDEDTDVQEDEEESKDL